MARDTIRIGVYIPHGSQLLDLACADIFHIASYEYLSDLGDNLPSSVSAIAPHVQIHWISSTAKGTISPLTAEAGMRVTNHYSDVEVAPGKLEIVLVPGAHPDQKYKPEELAWLAQQAATPGVDVLSICTGIFLCLDAGILKGKKVSGPRDTKRIWGKRFDGKDVHLVGDEYRWWRDGSLWSSGGITNGNDLVAAYIRQSERWPGPIAEIACKMADVGDRGQTYREGQTSHALGFVWQLVKAMFMGIGKSKEA